MGHWAVARNLEKFEGLNHKEIVNKLIDAGKGDEVVMYLEKFEELNHSEIVNKLIDNGEGELVSTNLREFKGLNKSIIYKLISININFSEMSKKINFDNSEEKKEIEDFIKKQKLYNLPTSECVLIKDKILEEKNLEEKDYQNLFSQLKDGNKNWQDEENILRPFEIGADYFGYEKMFKYIKLENRHDVLYNFRKIVKLAKESKLKPEQFCGQILSQVKDDNAEYSEGDESLTSYRLIKNQLDQIGKILGVKFEIEELGEREKGGDVMHTVLIRPVNV